MPSHKIEALECDSACLRALALAARLLGLPRVTAGTMIRRTAGWIRAAAPALNKATHFEVRNGAF